VAARWAAQWHLSPDGSPLHGWTGVVWPVRDDTGRPLVLKVSPPVAWTRAEPLALPAYASAADPEQPTGRIVSALAVDVADRVMLLPRLDHTRNLEEHPDIDAAVGIIGEILTSIRHLRPVAEVPLLADHLDGLEPHLTTDPQLDPATVDRARQRLAELRAELADDQQLRLLHGDCHFLNVLRSAAPDPPAWVCIDPGPLVGLIEWELLPLLRNRWADAVATGNPDRALRRRVEQVCEMTGGDAELAIAGAQVQAAAALAGWRLPSDHIHRPPYALISAW